LIHSVRTIESISNDMPVCSTCSYAIEELNTLGKKANQVSENHSLVYFVKNQAVLYRGHFV